MLMYFSVELCEQFSNCEYWTWVGSNNKCWLKTSNEVFSQKSGTYSGIKKSKCSGIYQKSIKMSGYKVKAYGYKY